MTIKITTNNRKTDTKQLPLRSAAAAVTGVLGGFTTTSSVGVVTLQVLLLALLTLV